MRVLQQDPIEGQSVNMKYREEIKLSVEALEELIVGEQRLQLVDRSEILNNKKKRVLIRLSYAGKKKQE